MEKTGFGPSFFCPRASQALGRGRGVIAIAAEADRGPASARFFYSLHVIGLG
jgi:hypothetical protein